MFALTLSGCTTIPKGRYVLNKLEVVGNDELDDEEIEAKIATRETARFLYLFPGVIYDYEIFDRYVLERDLQRVERYYRARGFYKARVRAGRVFYEGRSARVEIIVEEGPPVIVRRLDVHGTQALPARVRDSIRKRVRSALPLGSRFEEEQFDLARDELLAALADEGYARATAKRGADIDLPNDQVSVGFWVEAGKPARFGSVTIEGLGSLPEEPVRRALGLKRGDPYSQSDIDETERALLDLGVFSSVNIEPVTEGGDADEIPLVVRVVPAKLRSVYLGGGVQLDAQKTEVRLIAGWEDRNFLGGMRKFNVEATPGIVLYPTRIAEFVAPERLLPIFRLRAEFRQPGFLEYRTNALVRAQGSMYPVLLTSEREDDTPVLGYRDARAAVGLERSFWKLYGAVTHNVQLNSPFAYIGPLDPGLGTVIVSYPELFTTLDLRDDSVVPHKGAYFQNTLQVAGVGGDARDVRVQPEARGYLPLSRRVTLASRLSVGLLFAQNYGDTVELNARTGHPDEDLNAEIVSQRTWIRDIQLMFLRGFFSGGPGSNRGYALREVGPHGAVPFYNPGQTDEALSDQCEVGNEGYRQSVCDLPIGGFTLWEASLELRYPIAGALSGAVFVDTSDVAPKVLQFRFNRPHLSVGAGLRYDTPVGPIRVDLGYRVPGAQAPKEPDEGTPSEVLSLPLALSFGIGEAF